MTHALPGRRPVLFGRRFLPDARSGGGGETARGLGVGDHVVGGLDLLKTGRGLGIVLIEIGMALQAKLAKSGLDGLGIGRRIHSQNLVGILVCNGMSGKKGGHGPEPGLQQGFGEAVTPAQFTTLGGEVPPLEQGAGHGLGCLHHAVIRGGAMDECVDAGLLGHETEQPLQGRLRSRAGCGRTRRPRVGGVFQPAPRHRSTGLQRSCCRISDFRCAARRHARCGNRRGPENRGIPRPSPGCQ